MVNMRRYQSSDHQLFHCCAVENKMSNKEGERWSVKNEVNVLSDEPWETSELRISAGVLWERILGFQLQTVGASTWLNAVSDRTHVRYELLPSLEKTRSLLVCVRKVDIVYIILHSICFTIINFENGAGTFIFSGALKLDEQIVNLWAAVSAANIPLTETW